jgi:SWI/SNF-related matrix-associated actin-dependent regulator of chromatin subfamily A-like protein 1
MLKPRPHQLSGAAFLADRRYALLADEPRVGKTGAAIMAADLALDDSLLIVTTASGRAVWKRALADWSQVQRPVSILGWSEIAKPETLRKARSRRWSRLILDESHYAKSVTAARTKAAYGGLFESAPGLVDKADGVWCLTGTPVPNAPNDLWPMLHTLAPERLTERFGPTNVRSYPNFLDRYCVVRRKRLSAWRTIEVVVGGKNEAELNARLDGFMLRRTQADIGITEPVYETLPLLVSERQRQMIDGDADRKAVLDAALAGDTRELEMHMGPLRRMTGAIKAHAVADFVRDEFDCGLDKVVLMFWHTEVGDLLAKELAKFGVARVQGSTTATQRQLAQDAFQNNPNVRVFLGQIQAAGEAIDLSAAAELIFVEGSFVPKDMKQAALRITNITQARQPRVRVAVLEGSIDEALQEVLIRKWSSIREVLK